MVRPEKSAAHGSQPRPAVVVVVDPFSTGAVLAQMVADRGYQVVRVVSGDVSEELLHMLPAACRNLSFAATIQVKGRKRRRPPLKTQYDGTGGAELRCCVGVQHEGDVQATVRRIRELDLDIQAFTVGCESVRSGRQAVEHGPAGGTMHAWLLRSCRLTALCRA